MMYDMSDDETDISPDAPADQSESSEQTAASDKALVKEIISNVKGDKRHHDKAFKQMCKDMRMARIGADGEWPDSSYKANIVGRHVKRRSDALYAKNPKVIARRQESMDFAVWDETPESLQIAQQVSMVVNQANMIAAKTPPQVDPATGMVVPVAPPQVPGAEHALAVMQDFQQGMARREFMKRYTKTFEILYNRMTREQKPLDFKRAMKSLVRRACTTGVGYVELGFQREYGPRPGMTEKLADARARLDHIQRLIAEAGDGDVNEDDAEAAELQYTIASLQAEPEIVLREGLIFDYPASTKVIPDRLAKQLEGFVGARRVTIEYTYTVDQVKELFKIDLGGRYTGYTMDPGTKRAISVLDVEDEDYSFSADAEKKSKDSLVCVWKCYDKEAGLVYYVADGYDGWLRPPAAPDVFVEGFWPIHALTFNAVESENDLFPPSDVYLLSDMQNEYNRSRQGMREHRKAARPRWVYANGVFGDEDDPMHLQNLRPFEALGLNIDPETPIANALQVVPVPGVDPNLYETNQLFTDMQLVGGAQEAQFGATTDATATESAIAANATGSSDGSGIDDLDGFLTAVARDGGQILQREMSEEQVLKLVGPGAVWPQLPLAEIAGEVYLEIEAGSSGRPNQAVEINNWQKMLPLVTTIPNINPLWLARETLRRLDDRLDLTDAIISGIPSIVAMNAMTQPPMGEPGNDPNAQGDKGANNAEKPNPGPGSDAPMGDNRNTPAQLMYG